jgi:hypothetical protein
MFGHGFDILMILLALTEAEKFSFDENNVFRIIFGPKSEEVTCGQRKL